MTSDDAVTRYVAASQAAFLADLEAWLRIRSISADPARAADGRAGAAWLAEACRRTGFPIVELIETAGCPATYAEWPSEDPDAPVVLVYGHHDGQPVDPVEGWHSAPFEPVRRGDEMVGRGAADDKGQVLLHLLAVRAHLAATARATPRVHLKLLVTREGGSGPQADLADILDAPVVFLGVGLPDDRIHAPNERVVVPMLLAGARAVAHLWDEPPGALR
jgi:acetylornithine deacetylase/succinyl-diaminopimelate desuccinylase-like protein